MNGSWFLVKIETRNNISYGLSLKTINKVRPSHAESEQKLPKPMIFFLIWPSFKSVNDT